MHCTVLEGHTKLLDTYAIMSLRLDAHSIDYENCGLSNCFIFIIKLKLRAKQIIRNLKTGR